MPWLLDYFDLPSYNSESRERYTINILLICLGGSLGVFCLGGQRNDLGELFNKAKGTR